MSAPVVGDGTRWAVLIAHETRRALRNWPARAVFVAIGLQLAWFVQPAFAFALDHEGLPSWRSAPEQAIAGQVCLFMIANLLFLGYTAFDDQHNGMADRLRMSGVRAHQRLGSKLVVVFAHQLVTAALIYLVGGWWFGVRWGGSITARLVLVVALASCTTAMGFAFVSLCRSNALYNMVCYAATLGLTAASGGLAPYTLLPDWAMVVGRALPTWWFLRGIDELTLRDGSLAEVLPNVGVIMGSTLVLVGLGVAGQGWGPRRHRTVRRR